MLADRAPLHELKRRSWMRIMRRIWSMNFSPGRGTHSKDAFVANTGTCASELETCFQFAFMLPPRQLRASAVQDALSCGKRKSVCRGAPAALSDVACRGSTFA